MLNCSSVHCIIIMDLQFYILMILFAAYRLAPPHFIILLTLKV